MSHRQISGKINWTFVPYQTELFPLIETDKRLSTTQRIDYEGKLT